MTGSVIKFAAAAALVVSASAAAYAQAPNPTCQRLEAQLTSLDNGNNDPGARRSDPPLRGRHQPPAVRSR